jgi:hypothetical protein
LQCAVALLFFEIKAILDRFGKFDKGWECTSIMQINFTYKKCFCFIGGEQEALWWLV